MKSNLKKVLLRVQQTPYLVIQVGGLSVFLNLFMLSRDLSS